MNNYKLIEANNTKVLYTSEAISSRMIPEGLYLYDLVKKTENKCIIAEFDSISTPSIFDGTLISYKEFNINDEITIEYHSHRRMSPENYINNYIKPMKIFVLNETSQMDDKIYNAKMRAMEKIIAKYYDRNEDDITIASHHIEYDPSMSEKDKTLNMISTICDTLKEFTHVTTLPDSIVDPIILNIINRCDIPRIDWVGINAHLDRKDPELKEYFDTLYPISDRSLKRLHASYYGPGPFLGESEGPEFPNVSDYAGLPASMI